MTVEAQAGATPKDSNPGNPTPAGGNTPPGNDGGNNTPADKGGADPQYASFFQEQMASFQSRRDEIATSLKDGKLSDADKLRLEREDFELEKKITKYGYQKPDTTATVDLSFANEQQKAYLQNVLKDLPPEEARAVVEYTKQLLGVAGANQPAPANLDGNKDWERPGSKEPVKLNLANIWWVGEEGKKTDANAVREWIFGFLSGLKDAS